MNNFKKIILSFTTLSILASLAMAFPAQVALGLGLGVNATTTLSVSDSNAKTSADAKISQRITALNALETRINAMVRVSSDEKTSLDNTINSSLTDMTNLQAKIDADTDSATLKADIQSITKSYRIYVLVLPQGRITAAGDRILTIAGLFQTLSGKLQARITADQTAGQNVTALNTSLTDLNAKVTDANTQANLAIGEVVTLQPDNGSTTVYQSNEQVLNQARAQIATAIKDLGTARSDASSIISGLKALEASASASATTTAQ